MRATTWNGPPDVAQLAIDQCRDAIFWHRGPQIVYVNEQACRSLGYTHDELESMSLDDIDHGMPTEEKARIMEDIGLTGSAVFETMNRRKDGSTFPVEVSCTRHEVDGEFLLCGIARDITQRKAAEEQLRDSQLLLQQKVEELRQSENRYRIITEATSDGIVVSRGEIVCEVNDSFCEMFGISADTAVGSAVADILTPESARFINQQDGKGKRAAHEFKGVRAADGKQVDLVVVARAVEERGEELRISALRDISPRKRAERQLLHAMEAGRLGTYELNIVDRSLTVSDSFFRLFGLDGIDPNPPYELFTAKIHPEDVLGWDAVVAEALESTGPMTHEFRVVDDDGSIRWLERRGLVARGGEDAGLRINGSVVDITAKKLAQQTLDRSQRNLEMALEAGKMGTWDLDVESGRITRSKQAGPVVGADDVREYSEGLEDWLAKVHVQDRGRVAAVIDRTILDGQQFSCEYRVLSDAGSYRWVEARGKGQWSQNGDLVGVRGVVADIDNRKCAERELELRRFSADVCPETLFTVRLDGSIADANQTACNRLGYSRAELCQMNINDINETGSWQEALPFFMESGTWSGRGSHRCRDGRLIDVDISGGLFSYDGQQYICSTARDVTHQVQAEAERRRLVADRRELGRQLAHLNRLSSMNLMASAIAHELNQPLAAISNYAAILQHTVSSTAADDDCVEVADTILKQAVVAGAIVRRMRGFCADQPATRTPECLVDVIIETLDLLSAELRGAGVVVETNFGSLPTIGVDRVQIQQVLVNLVQNAVDSMAECPSAERKLRISAQQEDSGAAIRVSDNGSGICADSRSRLFEPFVSTKKGGMGIGLSISRSIIEEHGGKLKCEGRVGPGTTFVIDLPAQELDNK